MDHDVSTMAASDVFYVVRCTYLEEFKYSFLYSFREEGNEVIFSDLEIYNDDIGFSFKVILNQSSNGDAYSIFYGIRYGSKIESHHIINQDNYFEFIGFCFETIRKQIINQCMA